MDFISFSELDPPNDIVELAALFQPILPSLTRTKRPKGGIHVSDLCEALEASFPAGLSPKTPATPFAGETLHYSLPSHRVGISLQGGRALNNNDAILATLAAASDATLRWLFLFAPERYMGSYAAKHIVIKLEELSASRVLAQSLDGIHLFTY